MQSYLHKLFLQRGFVTKILTEQRYVEQLFKHITDEKETILHPA